MTDLATYLISSEAMAYYDLISFQLSLDFLCSSSGVGVRHSFVDCIIEVYVNLASSKSLLYLSEPVVSLAQNISHIVLYTRPLPRRVF